MQTNEEMGRELSPEELDKKRKEMLEFYNESMPYLTAQLEYEKKLAEIDEVRFKRFQISMQSAMMMQGQPSEEELTEMEKEAQHKPIPTNKNNEPKKKQPLRTS